MTRAQTFSLETSRPEEVGQVFSRFSENAQNGLLFLAGRLTDRAALIAEEVARCSNHSWLIVCGAGVVSKDGELEHTSAAVGLSSPDIASHLLCKHADAHFADALGSQLREHPGASASVFLRSDHNDDGWLGELHKTNGSLALFGGGTLPGVGIYLSQGGRVLSGGAAATLITGSTFAKIRASSACRLLSPLGRITRSHGPMVFEIDGASALDRLNEATQDLDEQPLVLLAIAGENAPLSPSGRNLALRAIQGVDPSRGALMVGDAIAQGTKVAFAVRDAHSARKDLKAQLDGLQKSCAGAAPEFGLYFCCAGRGVGLYGTPDVDVRLIRSVFPDISLIGLHSTFELSPLDDRIVTQIYTGVLGLYFRPS